MANNTVNIYGTTKGASEVTSSSDGEKQALFNPRSDLLTAASLPPYTELVRLGNTWSMAIATANAFNAVAAFPTTRAEAILYNGEATGGKHYVVHSMWVSTIVTAAAATQYTMIMQVLPGPGGSATAPTHSATTTLLWSRSGKAAYTGLAKRAVAVTTFYTDYWEVVGGLGGFATANVGGGLYADLGGSVIVPPGGALGLNVVAGTVNTAGTRMGCTWSEVQLTVG